MVIEPEAENGETSFDAALRQYQLSNLSGYSVLGVGSGTGIWLNFWRQHGADRVVGLDFAQPSVDWLKKQFPQQQFC